MIYFAAVYQTGAAPCKITALCFLQTLNRKAMNKLCTIWRNLSSLKKTTIYTSTRQLLYIFHGSNAQYLASRSILTGFFFVLTISLQSQTSLKTVGNIDGVNISWKRYSSTTNVFDVYRSSNSNGANALRIASQITNLSFTDQTGEGGRTYYYYVVGYYLTAKVNTSGVVSGVRLPSLTLSPSAFRSAATGQSFESKITANFALSGVKVTADDKWLTASISNGFIRIAAANNTIPAQRTGTLTVTGGGLIQKISVRQDGAATTSLVLSKTSFTNVSVNGVRDNSLALTVSTNENSWSVSSLSNWLSVTKLTKGIIIFCEPNQGLARTGRIRVSAGNKVVDVTVSQVELIYSLSTVNHRNVPASGVTDKLPTVVKTNASSWQVASIDLWLKVRKVETGFFITCDRNAGGVRTGTIWVTINGLKRAVLVHQLAKSSATNFADQNDEQQSDLLNSITVTRELNGQKIDSHRIDKNAPQINRPILFYPNPTSSELMIKYVVVAPTTLTLIIRDVSGRLVYKQAFASQGGVNETRVDVSKFPTGYFFLSVSSPVGLLQTEKILVKR